MLNFSLEVFFIQAFTHLETVSVKYREFGIKSVSLIIKRAGWLAFLMLSFPLNEVGRIISTGQDLYGFKDSVCIALGTVSDGLWAVGEWSSQINVLMLIGHWQH